MTFDHAFVREWLGSEAAGKFYCPPEDGRALLAEGLFAAFEKDAEGLTCWEALYLYAANCWLHTFSDEQSRRITDSFLLEDKVLTVAKTYIEKGKMAAADRIFRMVLDRADDRLSRHGPDAEILRRKAVCLSEYGNNLREQCCHSEAIKTLLACTKILQGLCRNGEIEDERNFLTSYIAIGDAVRSKSGKKESLRYYRKAQLGMERLTAGQDGAMYLSDLAICYERMGDVQEKTEDAAYWYKKAHDVYQKCLTSDMAKRIINCKVRLGDCYMKLGQLKKANSVYDDAYKKWGEYFKDPKTQEAIASQAILFDRAGGIGSRIGQKDKALTNFRESLRLRIQLEKLKSTPRTRYVLAVSYRNVADELANVNAHEAKKHFKKACAILEQLIQENLGNSYIEDELEYCQRRLSYIESLYKK